MARRSTRVISAAGGAVLLVLGAVAPGIAAAVDEGGRGHSAGATSLLSVTLGDDELVMGVVSETSQTSTDPEEAAGPSATERVTPLAVSSSLVPGLSSLSQPAVETHHSNGEDIVVTPGIDLGGLVVGAPVPGLLEGTIDPVTLRSTVGAGGAVSTATGAVRNLSVLGGFLSIDVVAAGLGSTALTESASAERHVQIDEVVALDLGALLAALGISLDDLPIDTAIDLLGALGVPLPGGLSPEELAADIADLLADTSAVRVQVDALQDDIDALQDDLDDLEQQRADASDELDALTAQLAAAQALLDACAAACGPLQAIVDARQAQVTAAAATVDALDAAIDATQAQIDDLNGQIDALLAPITDALEELAGLLGGILDGLDGAALLSLDGVDLRIGARAAGTLALSGAAVTLSVGDLRVGTVSLGALDGDETLAQLAAINDQLNATLADVLTLVDPSLAGVVDVRLLDADAAVTQQTTGILAEASFSGLAVSVTPPSVCGLVSTIADVENPIGAVLDDLGVGLPELPTEVTEVLSQLGSTVDCTEVVGSVVTALAQPLRLEVLGVSGTAFYSTPTGAGPGGGTTPSTGGTSQLTLGLALAGVGLGSAWLLRRSAGLVGRR